MRLSRIEVKKEVSIMKQRHVLLLSAILTLCITACNNNQNNSQDKSNGGNEPSSEPAQTPVADPNMEVNFKAIENDCMVPKYVQEYIDAMHEQEATITYPHRVDRLYCNMDWETAANQSDKGDGTTYDDDHSGGVDVCQMLSRSQSYENVPITLEWEGEGADFADAKVAFWSKVDKSDLREVAVESNGLSAKLPNLFRNTKYYYQLLNGDNASQMKNFVTGDYTRMITMGKISNVRDMGGYMTSYGVRTNQGLIYRGGEIAPKAFNDGGNSHSANWTGADEEAGQKVQEEVMNIGLELDLRTKSGSGSMTESALNWEGDWEAPNYNAPLNDIIEAGNVNGKAEYVRCAINSFDKFITDENRSSESDNTGRNLVKEIFEYYAQADKQHVYFHCWGGADRTGVTGFLLNAILGVSYTDAIIDFELTTLTNNKRCHMHNSQNAHMPKFLNLFVTGHTFTRDGQEFEYKFEEDKTLRYNADNLLKAMGVEEQTLEQIRGIMLPGYAEGKLEENEMVNKGWAQ